MFNLFLANSGLSKLHETFVENWLGPIYLICIGIFSIVFLKDRKFRELFSFIAIATIVALLIYFSKEFFSKEGRVTTNIKSAADSAL